MIIKEYDEAISNLRKKGADAVSIQKLEKERDSYLRDENYLARAIVGTEPEPALVLLVPPPPFIAYEAVKAYDDDVAIEEVAAYEALTTLPNNSDAVAA